MGLRSFYRTIDGDRFEVTIFTLGPYKSVKLQRPVSIRGSNVLASARSLGGDTEVMVDDVIERGMKKHQEQRRKRNEDRSMVNEAFDKNL